MNFEIRETDNGWALCGWTHWHGRFEYHYRSIKECLNKIAAMKQTSDRKTK